MRSAVQSADTLARVTRRVGSIAEFVLRKLAPDHRSASAQALCEAECSLKKIKGDALDWKPKASDFHETQESGREAFSPIEKEFRAQLQVLRAHLFFFPLPSASHKERSTTACCLLMNPPCFMSAWKSRSNKLDSCRRDLRLHEDRK